MSPLDTARALLAPARRVAVLTGAGMSAESGVPTFRDALTGLWARFDPAQLATPEAFRADPALVWRWYAERRAGVLRAQPHAGHRALAAAAARFERFALVTQNVDGLHARAGSPEVIELHGNILVSRCFDECGLHIADPGALPPGDPPHCPACGAWLRPDVVWFGEALDAATLVRAEREVAQAEVVLVVGTSGLVYPAAGLPGLARAAGAKVVVVNPNPSDIDAVADVIVAASAAQALPALFAPR
jgi:NAD-dependent deacetylase